VVSIFSLVAMFVAISLYVYIQSISDNVVIVVAAFVVAVGLIDEIVLREK